MKRIGMKRVVIVAVLIALIGMPALIWAGGQEEEAAETITLRIITNWGTEYVAYDVVKAHYDRFEADNPGIKLEVEHGTTDGLPLKVETGFVAGEEADIVIQNYIANVPNWVEDGIIVPVNDYLVEWGLGDRFLDSAIETFTTPQGDIAGFPLEGFSWPLWYNTAILDEAGASIPTTSDELIVMAQKIRDAGYQPVTSPGGAGGNGFMLFGLIVHTCLEQADAKKLFSGGGFGDNPNARKGVELFVKLRDAGVFSDDTFALDNPGSQLEFDQGKAAVGHFGSWAYTSCPDEIASHVELVGMPLPEGSPLDKPLVFGSFLAKGVYVTRNGTEKLDAVKKFITSFYEPKNIARIVEMAGITSPLKSVPVDPDKVHILKQRATALLPDVTMVPPIGSYLPGTVRTAALAFTTTIFSKGTSVDEIITGLDKLYLND